MECNWTKIAAAASLVTILTACGMSQEAKTVQEMIDQMPEAYSTDIDEDILSARNALDALSENDKKAVKTSRLEELEEAYQVHYQQIADEINEEIDAITSYQNITQMNQRRNSVRAIMQEIEELPGSMNDMVHYNTLLEKIQHWTDSISEVLVKANDLLVMESVFEKLDAINNARSASMKYSYAYDIESAVSELSDMFDTENLAEETEKLTAACLNENDIEITVTVLAVIREASTLSDSMSDYYGLFLGEDCQGFYNDCLEWEQIIQEKTDK